MTLDQLSAAASGGTWHHNNGGVTGNPWISTDNWTRENGEYVRGGCILNMVAHDKRQQDAAFIVALVNAYRTGQLVAVADDAIERVARTLAPNLEGGREFDQMPKDRAQLRQWTAQGMCLINDATQDDATWLAGQAIAAMKDTQAALAAKGDA